MIFCYLALFCMYECGAKTRAFAVNREGTLLPPPPPLGGPGGSTSTLGGVGPEFEP